MSASATDIELARQRILEAFDRRAAWTDGPDVLGSIYETAFGTGEVIWEIRLADVKLLAEAG